MCGPHRFASGGLRGKTTSPGTQFRESTTPTAPTPSRTRGHDHRVGDERRLDRLPTPSRAMPVAARRRKEEDKAGGVGCGGGARCGGGTDVRLAKCVGVTGHTPVGHPLSVRV